MPLVHLETEQAQRGGDDAGGAMLLESEFRMGVQVAAQRHEVRQQVGNRRRSVAGRLGAARQTRLARNRHHRPASTASASSARVRKW